MRERTIRSMLTERSAASIFATRDWLDPSNRPSCSWVILRRVLSSLTASASLSFNSTMAASSSLSPRNSAAPPTFHPSDSSRLRLRLSIDIHLAGDFVIPPQTRLASLHDPGRSLSRLLAEHVDDHDRVGVDSKNHSPSLVPVQNPKFVTSPSNRSHRSRMRHRNSLATLQTSQQDSRLSSGFG